MSDDDDGDDGDVGGDGDDGNDDLGDKDNMDDCHWYANYDFHDMYHDELQSWDLTQDNQDIWKVIATRKKSVESTSYFEMYFHDIWFRIVKAPGRKRTSSRWKATNLKGKNWTNVTKYSTWVCKEIKVTRVGYRNQGLVRIWRYDIK